MAITRYAGDRFTIGAGETKPTGVLDGAVLIDTGNLELYVKRDGVWVEITGVGTDALPGAPLNSVQFNNAGSFGGDADLTFTDGNRLNVNKLGISGNIYDSNNSIGDNGMVLTNEGTTGVNWKAIEDVLSGVGGSGVANYVARWADEDTLTTGVLVDNGTNVGINVPSPNYPLEISSSSNATVRIEDTTNNSRLDLRAEDSAVLIRSTSNFPMKFDVNQTERMRIDTAGKVGIGTNNPSNQLTLYKPLGSYFPISLQANNIGTAGTYLGIQFGYTGGTYQKGAIIYESRDSYARGKMHFALDNNANASNADIADSVMTLTSAGNVGIGVTTPIEHKLQVDGQIGGSLYTASFISFPSSGGSAGNTLIKANDDVVLGFSQNVYIKQGGKVGIGTTSPSAGLHVINSTEPTVLFESTNAGSSGSRLQLYHNSATPADNDIISNIQMAGEDSSGAKRYAALIQTRAADVNASSVDGDIRFLTYKSDTPSEVMRITHDKTVLIEDGLVGAPALSFINDINTGMWRAGSDNLRLVTGGTDAIIIDSSQHVGVGIVPQAKFEVDLNQTSGTLVADNYAHFGGPHHTNGSVMGITLGYREANLLYRKVGIVARGLGDNQARQDLAFLVSTVNSSTSVTPADAKLTISGLSGNVGIGITTSIGGKLHVNNPDATPNTRFSRGTGYIFDLKIDNIITNSAIDYIIEPNQASSGILFRTHNSSNTNINALAINRDGDVGIGTLNPTANLTVLGVTGTTIIQALGADSNGHADVEIKSTGTTGASRLFFSDTADQSGFIKYNHVDNSMQFGTSTSVKMHIDTSGQVQFNAYGSGTFTGTATQRLAVDSSGNVIEIPIGSGPVDGSGVANKVTYWTDTDTISYNNNFHWDNTNGNLGVGTATPAATVQIVDSTSGASVLKVDGTNGTLFEVVDDLSGSLMSVNDAAGLPVFEVFADNHIVAGRYNQNDFYLDTNGNLGLGTSAPSSVLDIYEQSGKDNKLRFHSSTTGSGTSNGSRIGLNGAELFINNIENAAIKIYTQSTQTNGITILGDGNVGIGTTDPKTKLHIDTGSLIGAIDTAYSLAIRGDGIDGIQILSDSAYSGRIVFGDQNSNNAGRIYYDHSTDAFRFFTNGTEKVSILSNGNVGIGATIPTSLLHLQSASSPTLQVIDTTNNVTAKIYSQNLNAHVGTTSNHDFSIDSNNTSRIYVEAAGNVGIGTTNPSTDFSVKEHLLFNDTTRLLTISNNTNTGGINLDGGNSRLYFSGYRALEGNNSGTTLTVGEGYGTTRISSVLNVVDHETILSPDQGSSGGVASRALTIENINDTSWTADALTAYNATTSYDIRDRASYSFFARPTQGNILTFASQTANNGTLHRFVNLNSSATEPLYRWDFFQYDGSGTGAGDFKVPDKLFQIRVREGVSNVEKFTIKGNGKVGIGINNPSNPLHVESGDNVLATFESTDANATLYLKDSNTTASSTFKRITNDLAILESGGNVGIGTAIPGGKLHVYGGTTAFTNLSDNTDSVQITRNTSVHSHQDAKLFIYDNSNSDWAQKISLDGYSYGLRIDGWVDYGLYVIHNTLGDVLVTRSSELVINESGNDYNFRVEGDTDQNLLFVDAGTDRVGIHTASPSYDLDVIGDISSTGQAIASYRRLRSYDDFTTSTNNTAGWYPLFNWGTTTGDRGGYRVYISYTGGNWAPNTTVLKVFKNWSGDATITIEKYGGTLYLPEVRVIGNASSATVYTLEVYLNALSQGHNFSVYYEALGYDETGASNVNWANSSLALSTNTGSVIASAKVSSEGIATSNLNISNDIYLGDQIIHMDDSNTYFQFPANDTMRLVANSHQRFNIETTETVVNEDGHDYNFRVEGDTDQNLLFVDAGTDRVGIGTPTPSYTLHTQGTIYASSRIGVQAVNTSYLATLGGSSDAKLLLTGSSSPYIRFQESTTNRAYIQWLSTTDSLKFQNQQGDYFDFSTHDEGSIGLRLMGFSGALWGYVYATASSGGGKNIGLLDGGGSWAIRHIENTKTEWRIDNDIKMTLLGSGNLGIGVTDPDALLEVKNSDRFQLKVSGWSPDGAGASAGAIQIGDTDAHCGRIYVDNTNTKLHITNTYNSGNGDIVFLTKTAGTTIDAVTIKGSGNVGIGTNNPLFKLHVNGDIYQDVGYSIYSNANRGWYRGNYTTTGSGVSNGKIVTLNPSHGQTASSNYHYIFELTTIGTGTNSGATYIGVYSADASAWSLRAVSLSGSTSNHPQLSVSGNNFTVYTNHSSNYTVVVSVTTVYNGDADSTAHSLGANYQWQRAVNDLYYNDGLVGIGTGTPSQKLHVQGNLRVTGAYYASDNNAGSSNQVLTSTGSGGTDWKSLSQIGDTVTGDGTTNKITKWENGPDSDLTDSSFLSESGTTLTNTATATEFTTTNTQLRLPNYGRVAIGAASTNSVLLAAVGDNATFNNGEAVIKGENSGNRGTVGHSSGSDLLRLNFSDALGMILNKDGHVGIGNPVPGGKLEISESGANTELEVSTWSTNDIHNSFLRFQKSASATINTLSATAAGEDLGEVQARGVDTNSTARTAARILFQGDAAPDAVSVPGRIVFSTSNTSGLGERMRIDDDGYVGIGTDNPKYKLDANTGLSSGGGIGYPVRVGHGSMATNGDGVGVLFSRGSAEQYFGYVRIQSTQSNPDFLNPRLEFGIQDTDTFNLADASTRMVILGNGNVGIGTPSPDAKLEILSDGSAAGGAEIRLTHANNNTNDVVSTVNFANNAGSVAMIQGGTTGANNTGYISFFTDNAGTSSEKVRIIGDGNVGIGTTVPSQQLHLTGSIRMPNTTSTTTGIIYKDTSRFIHNYQHPTGDTAVPAGLNTFVGISAGNLSMGSTATAAAHGSYNSGFGYQALTSLTTGYSNTAVGREAGEDITTGYSNTMVGKSAGSNIIGGIRNIFIGDAAGLINTSGNYNTIVGYNGLRQNATGAANTAIGSLSLENHTASAGNTALGYQSLRYLTTGQYNIAIGYYAGLKKVATGNLTNASYGIYLGYAVDGTEAASGEIVIGKDAKGLGSNTTRLGGSNITKTVIEYGNVGIGTNSPNDKLEIYGNMRVRGSDGFGANTTASYNPSYVAYPGGGKAGSSSGTQAGYIKITLPQSWTNTMMQFSVDVFEYSENKTKTFKIAGYNYSASGGSWHNASATVLAGNDSTTYRVEFGHDGSKCAIYISKGTDGASSSWVYPFVVVRDASFSFNSIGISNWIDGWGVTFSTATLSGITQTRDISTQVTGTGTSQYITKWNSTGTEINDSVIAQNSSNIGIGTPSPDSGLTIAKAQTSAHTYTTNHLHLATPTTSNNGGATTISFATSTVDQYGWSLAAIRETTTGDDTRFAFKSHGGTDGGNERFSILANGNVGIGATTPTGKLQIGDNYTINASYGGDDIYIKGTTGRTSYDPNIYNTDDIGALITISDSDTVGPTKPGLVLYNDDVTAGGFSPMLLFSKRESGNSPYKATMAGIYARAPLGTGDNDGWIDGELIFATAGAASHGIKQRMVINKEGLVGIGITNPGVALHVNGSAVIGDASRTSTTLTIRATNTAGSPASTAQILMEGYEGRGIGTFYTDSTYSGEEWFCGMNYSGNFNSWNIGYDLAGGQAEYLANTKLQLHYTGKLQLHTYGSGTHAGTAAYKLSVDSSGNVIETAIGAGAVDGIGIEDYVARWTDTDTLGIGKIRDDNSTVAINTAPDSSYMLKVAGNGYFSGTLTEASSLAIKENIENFTPSIDKINKIRPVKYNKKGSDKKEIGLIAEELEELFPELVEKDENGNPSGVNYSRAVTVLLGGFKELYKELQEIKKRI